MYGMYATQHRGRAGSGGDVETARCGGRRSPRVALSTRSIMAGENVSCRSSLKPLYQRDQHGRCNKILGVERVGGIGTGVGSGPAGLSSCLFQLRSCAVGVELMRGVPHDCDYFFLRYVQVHSFSVEEDVHMHSCYVESDVQVHLHSCAYWSFACIC